MSLSNHWRKHHAKRFKPPPPSPHMRLEYTELHKLPDRKPLQRLSGDLCKLVRSWQAVHDDWIDFLENGHVMQLVITVPAEDPKKLCCRDCEHWLKTFNQRWDESSLRVRRLVRMPPPTIRSV